MRLLRFAAVLTSLALITTAAPTATAQPTRDDELCTAAPAALPVPDEVMERRIAVLQHIPEVVEMTQNQGLGHWSDATMAELASGLSDTVIERMRTSTPAYPGGAPVPTFVPPKPMDRTAEPANPNFNCPRALAGFVTYSWFAWIVCKAFEIGSTFLGGLVCEAINLGVSIAVPWNNICDMAIASSRAPSSRSPGDRQRHAGTGVLLDTEVA